MERFVKGDIVVVPFPFSDLSRVKKRPAFVIARLAGDDLILLYKVGNLKAEKISEVIEKLIEIIRG